MTERKEENLVKKKEKSWKESKQKNKSKGDGRKGEVLAGKEEKKGKKVKESRNREGRGGEEGWVRAGKE